MAPPPPTGPYGDVLGSVCDMLARCPDAFGFAIAYRSRAECQSILNFSLTCRLTEESGTTGTTYGIMQTTPMVDDAHAAACSAWLESANCMEIANGRTGTPCDEVIAPAVSSTSTPALAGAGEACRSDTDCAADLYCPSPTVDGSIGLVTCQVCASRLAEGAACPGPTTRACIEGLHCTYVPSGPRTCQRPDPDGTTCYDDGQCTSGFCDENLDPIAGVGQCDAHGNDGEACLHSGDCRRALFCDGTTCHLLRTPGEACSSDDHCTIGQCDEAAGVCGVPLGGTCAASSQCEMGACVSGTCSTSGSGTCFTSADCTGGQICLASTSHCGLPLANGAACEQDEECTSRWCNRDLVDVCATRPGIGDPCSATEACGPRAYCQSGACVARHGPDQACPMATDSCLAPFVCLTGHCDLINLACRPAAAGEQCALLRVCDDASYCDVVSGLTCHARAAAGAPCTRSVVPGVEVCALGSTCTDDGTGHASCAPLPTGGQACTTTCADGGYCDHGVCRGAPIGRSCEPFGTSMPCPAGLYCDQDLRVCLTRGAIGASCSQDTDCDDGSYCMYHEHCVARLGAGQSCSFTLPCGPGLFCDTRNGSTCVALLGAGEACDWTQSSCAAGYHCPASTMVCTALLPAGASCTSNDTCASGTCYSHSFCQASAECTMP